MTLIVPDYNCDLCPRLKAFIDENRVKYPDKFNAPVPSFGGLDAELLIVGLAPGLKGANFTGRPFTGDYAGDLLYPTLLKFGFAKGEFKARPDDGLQMVNARITNAVKCVPPQNKPLPKEEHTCRPFLISEIENMSRLKVILALGLVAHNAVLRTMGEKLSAHKFAHGAQHTLPPLRSSLSPQKSSLRKQGSIETQGRDSRSHSNDVVLIDSYHCSRYNTNTGRLTTEMFEDVFAQVKSLL